ncbi:hypothetical protein Rsub_07063 [Raphidocelis subcapitata]|uniref:DUF7906 domain-containing protein n=1 Tax=Raphidocelis subcapitata TaxID=307507 RepID=A0A2V0P4M9_9CHLO|nr:hypothetical protein Rsub_07063 [Raphidocelis subcapitata]|eukprot:GBF94529.1 hypothetical protein Rsub_07063 [Raphidocelis subcapitata]
MATRRRSRWPALLLLLGAVPAATGVGRKPVTSLESRKWEADARQQATSSARSFLEESGRSLTVPLPVDVFLVGFDGGGGYGHRVDPGALQALLASGPAARCPRALEGGGELGVCFQLNYRVMGARELGEEGPALLRRLEEHLRANLRPLWGMRVPPQARGGRPGAGAQAPPPGRVTEYAAEAAPLEALFDAFLEAAYGHGDRGNDWHSQNPIVVINPSKVRISPEGAPEDAHYRSPDFLSLWQSNQYDSAPLVVEEAGITYRYSYNGVGESTTWLSSKSYTVIDVAAGPTAFGPAVAAEGAVTARGTPALRGVYSAILSDLRDIGPTLTAREHGQVVAQHAQRALFEGRLASAVADAARAAFAPDVASDELEWAKTVLCAKQAGRPAVDRPRPTISNDPHLPVVLLTDYDLGPAHESVISQEDYQGLNLTHVERSLNSILDSRQDGLVVSAHQPLSRHKLMAAAVWKARRQRAERALTRQMGHSRPGYHAFSSSFVDGAVLAEEVARAADSLTHGIVGAAYAMSKSGRHPIEQLRHNGTRVVPVFVFSLAEAPPDLTFCNREMVYANKDMVLVLQPLKSPHGSMGKDEFFTGHFANGRRLSRDGRDATRHIIAGLAQAVAGLVPPYFRPLPPGPHPPGAPPSQDWRWSVGATPFGPYGNYSGLSLAARRAARRNVMAAHASAALRAAQGKLDELDAFVSEHFGGPWAAAGIGAGRAKARKRFLTAIAGKPHGFKTGLTEAAVDELEAAMARLSTHIETLAVDLMTHDFAPADATIADQLLPAAAALVAGLDAALSDGRAAVECCRAVHVSPFGRFVRTCILAAAGFTAFFVAAVAVAACGARRQRRSSGGLRLPTTFSALGGGFGGGGFGGGAFGGGGGGGGGGSFSSVSRPASRSDFVPPPRPTDFPGSRPVSRHDLSRPLSRTEPSPLPPASRQDSWQL